MEIPNTDDITAEWKFESTAGRGNAQAKHGGVHRFINCLKCSGEDLSLQKKSSQYLLRGLQGCWRGDLDSAALTFQHRSMARQEGLCRGVGQGSGGHQRGMCLSGVMHSNCRGTFYTLLFIFYLLLHKYAIKQLADLSMWGQTRNSRRIKPLTSKWSESKDWLWLLLVWNSKSSVDVL